MYLDKNKKKLILCCFVSVLLCLVGFLAVLIPVPLFIIYNTFGTKKGVLASIISVFVLFLISFTLGEKGTSLSNESITYILVYGFFALIAFFMNVILTKKLDPIKGLIKFSTMLFMAIFLMISFTSLNLENSIFKETETFIKRTIEAEKERIKKAPGVINFDDEMKLDEFYKDAREYAYKSVYLAPSVLFFGVFYVFWLNLYLILKSYHRFGIIHFSKESFEKFLNYKTSDWLFVLVVPSLLLILFNEQLYSLTSNNITTSESLSNYTSRHPLMFSWIGYNSLILISVFYFFQGFGLFFLGLYKLKLPTFLRSFFVIFVLLMLQGIIFVALLGLVDSWIDLRKKKFFQLGPQDDITNDGLEYPDFNDELSKKNKELKEDESLEKSLDVDDQKDEDSSEKKNK